MQFAIADKAGIENAIGSFAGAPGGLMIMPDVFTTIHRGTIFELAARARFPTRCPLRYYAGGLTSYGSNFDALMHQAAPYVDSEAANPCPLLSA
jgi:putative ABC transport system substrate-binding protein